MRVRYSLGVLVSALLLVGPLQAQTCLLKEGPQKDSEYKIQITTTVSGELRIPQQKEEIKLKQSASAFHEFAERVLDVDEANLPLRCARHYYKGEASITIGGDRLERRFRPERAMVVAQRHAQTPLCFSPKGSFTREELELTRHFNTLVLPGLLPGKEVKVGETWSVPNEVAQVLCSFDGLTAQDLVCKLEEVKDGKAHITLAGKAGGIDCGASVQLEIQAKCLFDVEAQRILVLQWQQKDDRDQGPVSPALKMEVSINLLRVPVKGLAEVGDLPLTVVPAEKTPPESMLVLQHTDPKDRYELSPAREWMTVAHTSDHLVLRLMERGEFVSQATISVWPTLSAGKEPDLNAFKAAMAEGAGWEMENLIDAKKIDGAKGYTIFRVEAEGKLHGLKTLQYFHLIVGPAGDQVVMAFTLTPAQAQKLGTRDLTLVRSLQFPVRQRAETAVNKD